MKAGVDQLETAYDLWIRGIVNASRNLRHMEKPADEGGAKLQGRGSTTFIDNDNSESKEILRITEENISKVSDKQIFNIDKDFVFKLNNKSNDIFEYSTSLGGIAVNPQYGIVELSKSGSKSTVFHGFGREKLASIYGIKDTIENGTVISYTQNYNNKGYDRFIVCGKGTLFGNKETYLSVVIKSYPNNKKLNNKFYLHEVLLMESTKETDSPIMTGTQNSEKPVSESVSKNSISQPEQDINASTQKNQSRSDADYLSAVERGDMETAQRMVDEAAERAFAKSKIRDEDGKLVKVYHGTDADFTVFDRAMGRANMDIQGMFFSPWDIDAGGYGSNVRAFYLNITNPANESMGYKALNSHKGENSAGIKAREDLERMGYDGVNNSDEEYIAFNSKQIKSADPVTYNDKGKIIPLSERFDTEQKDIRYMARGDYRDALSGEEWMQFNKATIGDNQYANCLIGNTGVCFPGGNKLIVYDGNRYDPQIKAVYNLGDYEYNIHDGRINLAQAFISIWEATHDTEQSETVLQRYNSLYGTVFQKYSPESSGYVDLPRASDSDRKADRQESDGGSIPYRAEQTGNVKFMSRDGDFDFEIDLEDNSIGNFVTRAFLSHHEDIGEVLRNIADIDIDPKKVTSIVNRVIHDNLGSIDATARELLSTEIQIALDQVKRKDPAAVINHITKRRPHKRAPLKYTFQMC